MEQLKVGYLPLVKGSWVNGKQEIRRAEVIGIFEARRRNRRGGADHRHRGGGELLDRKVRKKSGSTR
ncbi:MAG: hypothetical protein L6W00_09215 [Lentisphaeria bacterium]|nr:MAG: hypothetical protein L6W00_09215 [Lentisphaeria bacterium]